MDPTLQKFLMLKQIALNDTPKGRKEKEERKNKNIKVSENEAPINIIIEEKPKLKYVVEYLQKRVNELNDNDI